jgi:hypothetical protein
MCSALAVPCVCAGVDEVVQILLRDVASMSMQVWLARALGAHGRAVGRVPVALTQFSSSSGSSSKMWWDADARGDRVVLTIATCSDVPACLCC